ncbi:MAG: hybrid sensor histidine kinase/response regulator [Chlamydiia bacterium]|nr:hybrid sensor histidine kinase/response regulator [Chlamydiia bacterium]
MELFLTDLESQVALLNEGLLKVERGEGTREVYDKLMRAAHSIKGAASMVGLGTLSDLAHNMEDRFIKLKESPGKMEGPLMNALFAANDIAQRITHLDPRALSDQLIPLEGDILEAVRRIQNPSADDTYASLEHKPREEGQAKERVLRVSSSCLDRLMGMAGESMVESLWLEPFSEQLLGLKHELGHVLRDIDAIRERLRTEDVSIRLVDSIAKLQQHTSTLRQHLDERLGDLDKFIRRHTSLSERLYGEVIDIRMRPFEDGVRGFSRYVRDLAQGLGKKVRLEIEGLKTPVDRDILEKLEAPLHHLLRNSLDHGIETPEERLKAGKPAEGVISIEASHRAGMLYITVSDDGRGVDIDVLRKKIVDEGMIGKDLVLNLTDGELLEFLFLPGFSTAPKVTQISGRGVGLNILQDMVQQVGGRVQTTTEKGKHLTFQLQLPLTLSVIRALLVEIGGEPYAFPLARIDKALNIPREEVETIENSEYFNYGSINVGLLPAWQVLGLEDRGHETAMIPVVMITDRVNRYGIVVDRFIEEKDIVVHELDPHLGKVPGISSGGFMEDGSPLLILDVDDMLSSVDKLLFGGGVHSVRTHHYEEEVKAAPKKILIVDDSITVREVQSRLLESRGYAVQTAVDGVDGWNAVRIGSFDMVITDVDMPRMNGIDLVKAIKADPRLHNMPIMIVSYKDRDSDRKLGLEAGADYYLTKSSFHDETLIQAVEELLGRFAAP